MTLATKGTVTCQLPGSADPSWAQDDRCSMVWVGTTQLSQAAPYVSKRWQLFESSTSIGVGLLGALAMHPCNALLHVILLIPCREPCMGMLAGAL